MPPKPNAAITHDPAGLAPAVHPAAVMPPAAPALPKRAINPWNFVEGRREGHPIADSFLLLVTHRARRKFGHAQKFHT
ncbi:MAG: hypothetical protein EXS33_04205 [Pedosphaera sp.]|nr:hypothetical protein [Pedosphaera sp.]